MDARVALHAADETTRLALVRAFERAPAAWDVVLWSSGCEFDVLVSDSLEHANTIRFDPQDPTRAVAAVAEALAGATARLTVVTGARRGCGVSTLALHLCAAFAETRDVCLLDLDPDSSLRARLDLAEDARHWGDVGDGILAAAVPIAAGFRILLAALDARGDLQEVVRAATARFEHVVVDAPPSPWRAPALARCTTGVLVVPPSRQGSVHALRVLDRHPNVRWSCVLNRMGAGGELTPRAVGRVLGRRISLELPASPYLRDREDDHRLLTATWSRYYRRICRLSSAVA